MSPRDDFAGFFPETIGGIIMMALFTIIFWIVNIGLLGVLVYFVVVGPIKAEVHAHPDEVS
ncbi:hypothetical protein [Rathayibacter festucae]|uniref:Uncharacterized protein n=1 Tax=Rathayibacter festucae DSM 15932 TaxID=1328866 RepID=A0A3Q9UYA8_9MICO|nr:hypothetical protein [Rathayibacter festucae]AZZ51440.1 hypothetical protein C1I64_04875 [Rathayibacter festucae DSM 15932]